MISNIFPCIYRSIEATLGSPAPKKPANENCDPQSVKKSAKKANKVQWDSDEEGEGDIENQQSSSTLLKVSTPNAKLLQSADKSERKEIMMNFWLSKGTITPRKL